MIPAQTMISGAVESKRRGAFMSLRSSLLEMGAASASLIGGYIVSNDENGKFEHYNWVGYLSVAIALSTLYLAKRIKSVQ
jgi:predicted MFS family arabinose efflux permease